jgi:regulator of sigma E protease
MGIVVGILILSIMLIVHEFGHFMAGRRLGFKIEEFSIFMGPVLFSWTRKNIKYSIKLLPIGASVRFAGELDDEGPADTAPDHFFNRPKWRRAVVIGAGPLLNFVAGTLALLLMFSIFGYTVPVIGTILPDSQASTAGLQAGDRVLAVNGYAVGTFLDYYSVDAFAGLDQPFEIKLRGTDGTIRTATLQPRTRERYRLGITIRKAVGPGIVVESVEPDSNGGKPVLQVGDTITAVQGIPYEQTEAFAAAIEGSAGQPIQVTVVREEDMVLQLTMVATKYTDPVDRGVYFKTQKEFLPAIGQALQWPWSICKLTLRSFGMMFAGTLQAKDALSGPIGVVTMISDTVGQQQPLADTIYQLLWLFAVISVSLGFMNLLPIPPLDGNHLVLIVLEAIRGRRLSVRTQNIIGVVGIGLIALLAVAGLYFDVLRLINR